MLKQPKARKDGNEIRLLGFLEKSRCQGKVHPVNGSWAVNELDMKVNSFNLYVSLSLNS